jgi:hypothetical protein
MSLYEQCLKSIEGKYDPVLLELVCHYCTKDFNRKELYNTLKTELKDKNTINYVLNIVSAVKFGREPFPSLEQYVITIAKYITM